MKARLKKDSVNKGKIAVIMKTLKLILDQDVTNGIANIFC